MQAPGYVVILNEMIHDARMIPLDGRPHVAQNIREWMGDSRGHWEGNTLVVDTTNFTPEYSFRGSDANMHLTERFTRVSPDVIQYEFTVDDPTAFTKPWTARIPMNKTPAQSMSMRVTKERAETAGIRKELWQIPPSTAHVCLYAGLKREAGTREPERDESVDLRQRRSRPECCALRGRSGAAVALPVYFFSISKGPDLRSAISRTLDHRSGCTRSRTRRSGDGRKPAGNAGRGLRSAQAGIDRQANGRTGETRAEVRGRIDYAEISTPVSTRHFANCQKGEIYGLSATPARFRMRSLGARTPVRNLYLTGSDACSSGVAGAMFGGIIAASVILKRNLVGKVTAS